MVKNQKISHKVNDIAVEQRVSDGFINATAMCVAHTKEIKFWLHSRETLDLFVVLSDDLGINSYVGKIPDSIDARLSATQYGEIFPSLIISKRGSPKNGGGVWLHPDLALQLAQWCNKPFAIQVSRWIREWMTTGQNPISSQADIDRLVYRVELKDEARLRATGQVKIYLESQNLYQDKFLTKKAFVDFHDAINVLITGEPAWKMRDRLSKVLGRKVNQSELIRDYFPALYLQKYIAICEASANLLRTGRCQHYITAAEEAAMLYLPAGYIPTPINFEEHISVIRNRISASEIQPEQNYLP